MNDESAAPIARRKIALVERPKFLPDRTGQWHLNFEMAVYNMTRAWTNGDYLGGYWEFYALDNGGWYMAMEDEARWDLYVESNGYRGTLSSDALGIVASLVNINHLLWAMHSVDLELGKQLHDAFYALREYASQHKEAAEIFGAID